jgi:sterol desaturase/sphingolipid hydroxylase (fatty acid hydroxylase superfamily)
MLFERSDTTRTDLYMFFYHQLSLDGIVVSLLGLFGPIFIYAFLVNHFNLGWGATMPPIAALLLFVVIDDFIAYWYHRFAHVVRPFWELHKFHHSCTEMNIITTHRDHPFEKAISMSLVAIPIVLIGPPTEVYLVFVVIRSLLNVYHHSNFDWTYGWLGYIFMSPRGHRLHHSMKDCHVDLNYGSFLSIWDQMFGTWYRGKDYEILLGATDNYMNQRSFFYDIWSPFHRFWKALLVPARAATPSKPPQSELSGATPAPGPSGPEAP